MGHPVTTNPLIIMLINMSIVFVVLMGLSAMIRLIHLCDPTNKGKKEEKKPAAAPKAAAPAAAPAAPKADNSAVIAVIAAAVAAYDSEARIVTVRPLESSVWKNNARATALSNKL
jgi:glutaconyl-CoA decarboxylase